MSRLSSALSDGYNMGLHLHIRSLLYGEDPAVEDELRVLSLRTVQGRSSMSYHRVLLRSLVPQVWVSTATARARENTWDVAESRLLSELEVVHDGVVVYDWVWRSVDRIDPSAPAPDAGPQPISVLVNGEPVVPEAIQAVGDV